MKQGTIVLTSSAFRDGDAIPVKYTCDGEDISPPLAWSGIPSGATTLALIVDDPDAPSKTWVHWVAYNVPATENGLSEGIDSGMLAKLGAREGKNDFGRSGYGGPCPPDGMHHYHFKLYALDAALEGDLDKEDLLDAMKGHIVASAELIATYTRKR